MHTIDLLKEALQLADRSGWQVRMELLNGSAGGACRLGKNHLLFVDKSLTATEQLEQVIDSLRNYLLGTDGTSDPFVARFASHLNQPGLSSELKRCFQVNGDSRVS